MTRRICIPVLLLLAACGGCTTSHQRYFLYLFAPASQTKTVAAEFADFPGHSVAVVVYAGESVVYEYPYARLRLTRVIAAELEQRVRKVKIVDPRVVLRYQDENVNWDSMAKTELGKAFKTDYVLLVSLMEYTSQEPGSVGLSRGRINAEASVYQTSLPEARARVWEAASISAMFPEDAPMGLLKQEARGILDETERRFVDALVKKFYKHKVEVKP
jgi:hypothetical protein